MIADATTALTGTRLRLTFDHSRAPGTAPSRLNANIIRDVDVRHDVVQYSWPMVEMIMIVLNSPGDSAVAKMPATVNAAVRAGCVDRVRVCAANRNASSRIQPPIAE